MGKYTDIDDPSKHFQAETYTGTGSELVITNDGNSDLQPDFIWIKQRNIGQHHNIYDSNRGATTMLYPNLTNEEYSAGESLKSFNTDGFTVGNYGTVGTSGGTYVAWQWKANGGTTSTDTSGSITSTVQANQDAGFSIVTWTGNGANTTLGHGLGVEPEVIIQKARGTTSNWAVYHKQANATPYNVVTYLNLTDATGIASNSWGTAASDINSNTFYLKHWFNYNTTNVAYCFAEKQGYSKFGKYVGNGNANGPFIYTGFKPAFFLLKKTSAADGWRLFDNKRAGYNDDNYRLAPDASDAEDTATTYLDILSNGVKIRGTAGSFNQSGGTFIYMAFAENPFTTSTGIPTTAR